MESHDQLISLKLPHLVGNGLDLKERVAIERESHKLIMTNGNCKCFPEIKIKQKTGGGLDIYLLKNCNEEVNQKNVGHKKVAGHDSRCEPGARNARRKFLPIFVV